MFKKIISTLSMATVFIFHSMNAQINTPVGASIPFGSNVNYSGTTLTPSNLPTGGTYAHAQDAANAYNQWKNDYVEACGSDQYRVKYDNIEETVSEGIAYGMMLAAYAADKDLFDGLWAYYKANRNENGVMNWKIYGCSQTSATGGAADAEVDVALALMVANHQWSTTTPHDYKADAEALIQAIADHEIQPVTANGAYQLNNGDQWGFANDCRNPSYQPPAYFKAYGTFTCNSTYWDNCVDASYTLLNNNAHPTTGLVSNWSDPMGNPNNCNGPDEYGWDACRNPWRMATDVAWYDDTNAKNLCDKMATWLTGVGVSNIRGPLPQDGTVGAYHSPSFIATFACAVMASDASNQNLLDQIYTETVAIMDTPPWYFGNTLRCISLFMLTGNFWNPAEYLNTQTGASCDDNDPTTINDVYDDNCNCTGTIAADGFGFKIMLEGFIQANGTMTTALNTNNLIPFNQPFNTIPWNYGGMENLSVIPFDMVDWVLLNFYDISENILESQAVYVDANGNIFDVNGNANIAFTSNYSDIKYVSIHHKSHLAAVADVTILTNNFADFTQAETALGIEPTKNVFGIETLYSGDFDCSGIINNLDFNVWTTNSAIINQYVHQDADGNGITNNLDYNLWIMNRSKVGNTIIYY